MDFESSGTGSGCSNQEVWGNKFHSNTLAQRSLGAPALRHYRFKYVNLRRTPAYYFESQSAIELYQPIISCLVVPKLSSVFP